MEPDVMVETLRRMHRIRAFEERVASLMKKGQVFGGVHLSLGQEAETVGACMALNQDDYMTGNHRSHGHPIAKGAQLGPLMAELLGKTTGVCKGKGGSMHLADFSVGSLGESGIVGGSMPVAVGAGLSAKIRGTGQVCLCFFGDGASNQGTFHEALNLASVWKVPTIFLCENNQYAVTTPVSFAVAGGSIAGRGAAYGVPGRAVDGQDPVAVYDAVREAAMRARGGEGPSLIEAKTYRYKDHAEFGGLTMPAYRTQAEIDEWMSRDPISVFSSRLVTEHVLTQDEADQLATDAVADVDAALKFARSSDVPDLSAAYQDVYSMPVAAGA